MHSQWNFFFLTFKCVAEVIYWEFWVHFKEISAKWQNKPLLLGYQSLFYHLFLSLDSRVDRVETHLEQFAEKH